MASQLGPAEICSYLLGRANANVAAGSWTDSAGQAWKISITTASGNDPAMTTHMRIRFDPVILLSLLPDYSRQSQQFDVGFTSRDTTSGDWHPNW